MIKGKEFVIEFDEDLFTSLVERIRVKSLVEVVFVLKAGLEVREKLKYLKMHENYDITLVC
ncbi:hypothetical protein [Clostridium sp. N3C]|jgi:hypothetical protein|uniref:hypothetical protein n=1 Tax=Clostridium sp. N3C TaxID=1776758 RepID=UPI00117821D5|nr:hypothetical protein [Clostridium sp. N3C]